MGNVVQCCHVLSNYISHKDAPAQGDAERSPLLSREGSECDSFTPQDNLDEEEEDDDDSDLSTVPAMVTNPTLEQGRFLFPDIILSSSLGGEVSVVEPVVCLLVSEEEEEGPGEKGPESSARGRRRLYTEVETQTDAGTQTAAWVQTLTHPCHAEVQTQFTQTEMPTPSSRVAEGQECTEANTQTKTEMIQETVTERFAVCETQNQADVLLELHPRADKKTPGPLAETMALSGKQPACVQSQVQVPMKVGGQRERCTVISGKVVKDVYVEQRETGIQDILMDIKYNKDTFLKEHSHGPVEEVITNTKQIAHEETTTTDLNTANEGEQLDWVEHSTFQTHMHVGGLVLNSGSPQKAALMPTKCNADNMGQNPDLLQKDTDGSQHNVDLPGLNVQITECIDHAAPCVNQTQQEALQVAEKVEGTVGQRAVLIHENVPGEDDYVASAKLETIVPTAECTGQKTLNAGESIDQAHQNSIQNVQSTLITVHNVNQTHQNSVQTVHHTGELNGTTDHQTDLNIVQTVQDIVQAEHSPDQADQNIVLSEKNVDQMNAIVETEHDNPEPDQSTAEPKTVDNLDETAVQDAVELEVSGSQRVKEKQPHEAKQVTLFLVDRLFLATPPIKVPPIENVKTSADAASTECDEDKGEGLSIQEVVSLQEAVLTIRIQSPGTELFEVQISGQMLVAELNQVLMDHELTCHRTCFSLHLGGAALDNLAELHSVPGIQDEALIKVVEETYTVRDARLHLRHVRDLLRSLDPTDAHNGVNGSSLSYLSIYTEGETEKESWGKRRSSEKETIDCSPPEYILPGCKECPLTPLQPVRNSWKPLQCLRVLTMSSWNPPPGNRKMHGDLMYINVVTMEDRDLNITSSSRGFYLNQSTAFTFNPKPALPKILCHSLVELLSQVSPAFRKNYSALQKKRVQRHPYERIVTPFQVYTWTAPHGDHVLDWVRAEETHTIRMGQDEHTAGQSRDWNEELQCCRELPRNTVQERLQRERNIFKTNSDFVAAATQGAMAVVDGNIMAINPGEAPHMQMFIWNSMFFSLGFDISDHYRPLGGNAAAHTAANCDQRGVQAYAAVDTEGLHTLGTAVVDYRGYRVIAQTIVAGILEKSQDESVVYGSNDHGKTVLTHPRFMELLEKTSGPLRLHRHSVLDHSDRPVELYSCIDTKGILGNDGRHYILDLLRTFPRDLNFLLSGEEQGEVPTECRSLGYPRQHRHSLAGLRPELMDAFVQHRYELFLKMVSQGFRQLAASGPESQEGIGQSEDKAWSQDMEAEDLVKILRETGDTAPASVDGQKREMIMKASKATGSVSDSHFDIRFNPDVCCAGVRFPSECAEDLQRQKQLLWDAAAFLLSNQIPAVLRDCLDQTVVPMDGATLTTALHQRGVSVRYLGTLLELLERSEEKERLSHIERIAVGELVIRSAKHIFKIYLQDVEPAAFSAAVSHFLNCLLSSSSSFPDSGSDELLSRRRGRRRRTGSHGSRVAMLADSVWARLTPGDLWVRIRKEAEEYYHYTLCSDSIDYLIEKYSLQKISLLREMTMKTGIQVQLREYAFDSRHRPVFAEEDVVNMFPVVKHLRPTSSDATRLVQQAQVAVQQGLLKDGYEMLSQALTLFSTVCGVLHEDMCMCLRLMGRISYILGEYSDALSHQEKVAMVSERVQGIDHPQTTQDYTYLALYCFAGRQPSTSLHLLYRARYLTLLVSGEDHPQLALLDSMLGLVLHGLMEYDLSLKFLQNALTLTAKYHGAKSVKLAHSHHLLATVFESKGEFRSALHHEKEAYSIYKDRVGESHESTKESSEYLKTLTQQAVILQKAINHIYSNTSSACIPPPKFSTPSLPMILQQLNLTCGIIFIPLRAKELGDLTSELKGRGTAQALDVENQQTLKD